MVAMACQRLFGLVFRLCRGTRLALAVLAISRWLYLALLWDRS